MAHRTFYSLVFLMLLAFAGGIFLNYELLQQSPELLPLFLKHLLPLCHCTLILGFGLGLPLILIATLLGWGQLLLLVNGQISPHLGKEGLFKVLHTLFGKF